MSMPSVPALRSRVSGTWRADALPALECYVAIPALSPAFDPATERLVVAVAVLLDRHALERRPGRPRTVLRSTLGRNWHLADANCALEPC